jgi:hypothetical protein
MYKGGRRVRMSADYCLPLASSNPQTIFFLCVCADGAHEKVLEMNKEKEFDCIKFKYELQEKTLKSSGAKNLREYVNYVNKIAQKSSLHKSKEKVI